MDEEIAARVELACLQDLRRAHAQRLIERFGSARAVLGVRAEIARGLAAAHARRSGRARGRRGRARRIVAEAALRGIRALAPGSAGFPAALASIPDPPLVVWLRGALPDHAPLAIVGARRASARGLATARSFAARSLAPGSRW